MYAKNAFARWRRQWEMELWPLWPPNDILNLRDRMIGWRIKEKEERTDG
jgi:hypothetical protein